MADDDSRGLGRRLSETAVVYLLWALSAGLALFALLWVRVLFFVDLPLVVFMVNPWLQRAIDRFGSVILGLIWLIFAVGSETYFRHLYERPQPAASAVKVFGVELAVLIVSYSAHLLIG